MNKFTWERVDLADSVMPEHTEFEWRAPSNIALIKYWGKHGLQLPSNASLSMTLSQSCTLTSVQFDRRSGSAGVPDFEFRFGGHHMPAFEPRIRLFLERILPYVSWLSGYSLRINSDNSFPHSSGIASSASSMAALALCVMSMEEALTRDMDPLLFFDKASFLARLGSGSASRSLFGGFVSWGKHPELPQGNEWYASPLEIPMAEEFIGLRNRVLIVEEGSKSVSSSVGHGLMDGNPFAPERYRQAEQNLSRLIQVLQTGEREEFIRLVEGEALMLHALMMSSSPYYLLVKPNTVAIIERLWEWRRDTGAYCCFTLDAGANVHILYPDSERDTVEAWIDAELLKFCQNGNSISDRMGSGPKRIVSEIG